MRNWTSFPTPRPWGGICLPATAFTGGCLLFLLAFPAYGQVLPAPTISTSALSALARLEKEKVETTDPGKLMDTLNLRPGMDIVDIGAGTGQWSYAFAERLKGKGRIYATEIDPLKVSYMEEEARRRGHGNLHPVLVSPDGIDPFYTGRTYDVIFLSHVYYYVKDTEHYFSTLRKQLNDGGALVVIVLRATPFFSPSDVSDYEGLRHRLSEEGPDSPFIGNLSDSTKALLDDPPNPGTPDALKKAVVDEFNAMLDQPRFHEAFDSSRLSFTPEEERHYLWLLGFVEESISYDGRQMPFMDEEEHRVTQYGRLVRLLNRLVIFQHFREYLDRESLRASALDRIITEKLAGEGYVLKESLDLYYFNYILVFEEG